MFQPGNEAELIAVVADAAADGRKLSIEGGGSKVGIGAPAQATVLSMGGLSGVVDYDPAELVLTVRPGTPLADVEALVQAERQMLAFEPFDHGPLFGGKKGRATIGGVVAAGVSGSRRLSAGGARDHILGLRAVSGRGEAFVAGAKVVKNVTGYDMPKLAANSWGRLFALSEITLKVLPKPEVTLTLGIESLADERLSRFMAAALGSQAEVAAIAHLPRRGRSLTILRLEGFGPSVVARAAMLRALFSDHAPLDALSEAEADAAWESVRTLATLPAERPLWRINTSPKGLAPVLDALRPLDEEWLADWAGGLLWLALDGDAAVIRDTARLAGGHAMLVRAPATMRSAVPAFQPAEPGVAALEDRVRRAFDPLSLFETGRF
ncbi:FAD-binding protein [Sphingobium sp.]|uniref:FAD-binding protein n=1 Tax=Sphingobium sp. TaxID=1912891 RepID=UPI002B6B0954|nr:FAD-binding protein [Sphingobium sp.]HUD90243.1 FAD-binding protein [Sphingobium sp.]